MLGNQTQDTNIHSYTLGEGEGWAYHSYTGALGEEAEIWTGGGDFQLGALIQP